MIGKSAAICHNYLMMNTNTIIPCGDLLQREINKTNYSIQRGSHITEHQHWLVFTQVLYPGRIAIWSVARFLCREENPENPRRRTKARINNKLKLYYSTHISHTGQESIMSKWALSALLPWNWQICAFWRRILGVGLELACNIIKTRQRSFAISLSCKLVPVRYREHKNGLLPVFKPWRTRYESLNYGISNYWST